jgi:hypothetical protein
MIPIGINWALNGGCNYEIYNDNATYLSSLTAPSNGYITCSHNGFEYRHYNEGNYTDVSGCAQATAGLKPLRTGFYRINVKENGLIKTFAYFDWRDRGFIAVQCGQDCFGRDMSIRYDGNTEELWFWSSPGQGISNQTPDLVLEDGDIISYAVWQCGERDFSPFWSKGLILIQENNHPNLLWGPYNESFQATHYKIYRAVVTQPTNPKFLTFSLIATTNSSTFEFVDNDVEFGEIHTHHFYYYVKAYNSGNNLYSSATNTLHFTGIFSPYKKSPEPDINFISEFALNQNYPNPFNPSTEISYTVTKHSYVSLKVYDVLGNGVAELVMEEKDPGNYSVSFNASKLSTGIYFYTLRTEGNSFTKKMLLTK